MAFMNLNYQFLIYEDKSTKNPNIRMPDITNNVQEICVSQDKSDRITLYPNDIKTLTTTSRPLGWDTSTQLSFSRPYAADEATLRLQWTTTGANPAFRVKRNLSSDATTVVSLTRVTPYVMRITAVSGTIWSTAAVQVGDFIKFEKTTQTFTSPFSDTNQGQVYQVQTKGTGYIDFIDNGGASIEANIILGTSFDFAFRVFTQGPTRIGDLISIGGNANLSNQGVYEITQVSPDYIEVIAPLGVEETLLYTADTFVIYDYLIGFIHLRSSDEVQIKFGGQTEWITVKNLKGLGLFIGSVSTFEIQARNVGFSPVEVSIQTAKLD